MEESERKFPPIAYHYQVLKFFKDISNIEIPSHWIFKDTNYESYNSM